MNAWSSSAFICSVLKARQHYLAKKIYEVTRVVWLILGTRKLPELEETGSISKCKCLPLACNEICVLNHRLTNLNKIRSLRHKKKGTITITTIWISVGSTHYNHKQSQIARFLQNPLKYVTGIRCLHSNRKTRQNKTLQLIVSKYKKLGTKPAIEWALIICHLVLQMFPMREDSKKTFHLKPREAPTRSWVILLHSFRYF